MSKSGGVHPAVKFYLPGQRWLRELIRWGVLGLTIVWLPAWTLWRCDSLQSAKSGVISAMEMEAPYTEVEAQEAAKLLAAPVLAADIPVWLPPPNGMIQLPPGQRFEIEYAHTRLLRIQAALKTGSKFEDVANLVNEAREKLEARDDDRSFDHYYKGLLDLWSGSGSEAVDAFAAANRVIDQTIATKPDEAGMMRLKGVKVATLYAMGHAALAAGGIDTTQGREAALLAFNDALRTAGDFPEPDSSDAGGFVRFESAASLVNLFTGAIWNDVIVVLMHDRLRAPEDIPEVRLMTRRQGNVRREPTLGSNVAVLMTMPEGASNASLKRRQDSAKVVWDAGQWRPNETRLAHVRAQAAFAILDLGGPIWPAPSAGEHSPVRRAHAKLFPGAASSRSASYFEPISLPAPEMATERLDRWLFIREWRRQLREGDLGGYTTSMQQIAALQGPDAFDLKMLRDWRSETQPAIRARADEALASGAMSEEERRSLMKWLIHEDDFWPTKIWYSLLNAFGGVVPMLIALAIWGGFIFVAGLVSWMIGLYVRTFTPLHFEARRKLNSK